MKKVILNKKQREETYKRAWSQKGKSGRKRVAEMAKAAYGSGNKKLSTELWKIHGKLSSFAYGVKTVKGGKR